MSLFYNLTVNLYFTYVFYLNTTLKNFTLESVEIFIPVQYQFSVLEKNGNKRKFHLFDVLKLAKYIHDATQFTSLHLSSSKPLLSNIESKY
jgi:hypothetical protein